MSILSELIADSGLRQAQALDAQLFYDNLTTEVNRQQYYPEPRFTSGDLLIAEPLLTEVCDKLVTGLRQGVVYQSRDMQALDARYDLKAVVSQACLWSLVQGSASIWLPAMAQSDELRLKSGWQTFWQGREQLLAWAESEDGTPVKVARNKADRLPPGTQGEVVDDSV